MRPIFQHGGPVYLRDLAPNIKKAVMDDILRDPKLKANYDIGKDIVVGRFIRPMTMPDYFAAEGC